jgi:predicted  nucleic acid-binding Zn-ribbon protein
VQQIRSLKQHEQEMNDEFNELQDRLKDSLSRLVETEAVLADQDSQIANYKDLVAELEVRLSSARAEAAAQVEKARVANAALSDLTEQPAYFDIILRCSDGDMGWNLIR